MRLTLRTLLAYLDEILEPADAIEMGQKVEQSEFATSLTHRIRDVMRRIRLAAPKLEGRGVGLDPNTVAEYLDNTLSDERVPDFEKVCLESDVHLAEVAASHQILTLVLGEPADVDRETRERMYRLLDVEPPPLGESINVTGPPPIQNDDGPAPVRIREKPRVPDYLREATHPKRRWLTAAAALGGLLIVGAIVLAIGPDRIRALVARADSQSQPVAVDEEPGESSPLEIQEEPVQPAIETNPAVDDEGHEQPADEGLRQPGEQAAPNDDELAAGNENAGNEDVELELPLPPLPDDEFLPPTPDVGDADVGESSPPPSEDAVADAARDPFNPATPLFLPDEPTAQEGADEPPVVAGVGRFVSDRDVLLRYDAETDAWVRAPRREVVVAGDRYLALPSYRAKIDHSAGFMLEVLGDSAVEFEPVDAEGAPGLRVEFGRVVLLAVGAGRLTLRLQLGDAAPSRLEFGDGESMTALHVRRAPEDGVDPIDSSGRLLIDYHVLSGTVGWRDEAAAAAQSITGPKRWTQSPDGVSAPDEFNEAPAWIAGDELSPIERQASVFVEDYLQGDKPVALAFKELAIHRRAEVRSLAARCMAVMGEFDPFVKILGDPLQRAAWAEHVEALRVALWRSPESAQRLKAAFERARGEEDGAKLYRLLQGYSRAQLTDGASGSLLAELDHEDLEHRVLGYWALRRATGLNLPYYPEYPADRRQRYVDKWRQRMAESPAAVAPVNQP